MRLSSPIASALAGPMSRSLLFVPPPLTLVFSSKVVSQLAAPTLISMSTPRFDLPRTNASRFCAAATAAPSPPRLIGTELGDGGLRKARIHQLRHADLPFDQ